MLERLTKNWPLKLLALAIAFGVWVAVTGEKSVVQDLEVPLVVRLPENIILAVDVPNKVIVRVRGVESLMRRLDRVPMELVVDVSDSASGERDVQFAPGDVAGIPQGVSVESIDPDRLTLVLDRRLRRELPIEPMFLGQPPEGYSFYGAVIEPRKVVVEGPATELEKVELIRTNPIRLDQRRQPFSVRVGAVPDRPRVRVLDPVKIQVSVDVFAAPVDREFPGLAVELIGQTYESAASPESVSVTLSGPPSLLDGLTPQSILVVADCTGLEPSARAYRLQLKVELIEVGNETRSRINVKATSKSEVKVRVSDRKLTS